MIANVVIITILIFYLCLCCVSKVDIVVSNHNHHTTMANLMPSYGITQL